VARVIPRLAWGLARAVPEDALGVWGCRAIVTQDGFVDLVPDRTDQAGSEIIFDILTAEFPTAKLRQTLGDMLRSGQVNTRRAGQFDIYRSSRLVVVGNTNASAGHCYLAAWTGMEVS
jgi:hypothetical protein